MSSWKPEPEQPQAADKGSQPQIHRSNTTPRRLPRLQPVNALGIAFALTLLTLVAANPASAYLEPGTATYILQTVLAAVLSSLYLLRLNWQRVKGFFKSRFGGGEVKDSDS